MKIKRIKHTAKLTESGENPVSKNMKRKNCNKTLRNDQGNYFNGETFMHINYSTFFSFIEIICIYFRYSFNTLLNSFIPMEISMAKLTIYLDMIIYPSRVK